MGILVNSVSFRHEIISICKSKTSQNDTERFVVFDAISVYFPRDFVLSFKNQLNERSSYALHFLKRTLRCFLAKTLEHDSKVIKKLQHLHFRAICVLFESF